MNIADIKTVKKVIGEIPDDMLIAMFNRQKELMDRYHPIEEKNLGLPIVHSPVDLQSCQGQARLKDFAWRITEELGEAMSCLKNKLWKSTPMQTDVVHYKEELADAMHFFLELCILSGIGPEELHDLYFRKSEVNKFRQGSNY